ncbi:MAG TPA: hypothetical protein VGC42_17460 [Kofleriaceae bacterium]
MAAAVDRFDRASTRVAQAGADVDPATATATAAGDDDDLVRDRVEQLSDEHAFAANAATIRTADEMVGTLIDTVA